MTGVPMGCRFLIAQDKDHHRSALVCARDTSDPDHRHFQVRVQWLYKNGPTILVKARWAARLATKTWLTVPPLERK
jgi:hypothetical protein